MQPSQRKRPMAITTALGEDALVLNRFTVRERLSAPFEIEAELSTEDSAADFDAVVGHRATIQLSLGRRGTRSFDGYVSRLVQTGKVGPFARYRATLVPWLWFLTRTSDCRVFQRLKVLDIAEEVFNKHRFGSDFYDLRTRDSYTARRYCVQYRETDFNFIGRLLESEGISYWFDHQSGRHKLVLADNIGASKAAEGNETLDYHDVEQGTVAGREVITGWLVEKQVQPVEYALKDYDFKKPSEPLKGKHEIRREHGMARFAMYDYPGEYFEAGDADRYARLRLEELQAGYERVQGVTTALNLAAGSVFTLDKHPRADQNRKYLITELSLTADAGEFASGGSGGEFFTSSFTAIPSTTPYRPPRITPKPVVQGPQTAVVVGPSGEEIHTEEHARVKVQFHWDRYGKMDDTSSCWVRVAQNWAGKGWGAIATPRIGQEVVVEFLEGDPDRPLITGRVYNAEATPPYDLPAHKTISTTKSLSSKGGQGFNEIRFEDKKGDEQIFVHGEKNLDVRIKNDAFEWIGNDRHLIVKKDQIEHVENNRDETVDADHKEKIGKDRHLKVAGKEAKAVDGSKSLTVKGDVIEVFKANHSEQVTSDYYLKADNICIEAMTNITLKVGQTTLAMEATGLGIKTTGQVKIESTGPMEIKATGPLKVESVATADLKSPMTSVKGDGMVIVQGGLVKIN